MSALPLTDRRPPRTSPAPVGPPSAIATTDLTSALFDLRPTWSGWVDGSGWWARSSAKGEFAMVCVLAGTRKAQVWVRGREGGPHADIEFVRQTAREMVEDLVRAAEGGLL